MRKLNTYTETSNRNNIILLVFIFIALIFTSYFYFTSYKQKVLIEAKNNYELNMNYLNSKVKNYILDFDKNTIKEEITKVLDTTLFNEIKIEYTRFIFDKNSLINSTPNFDDKSWRIAEIVVDARYGFIKRLEKSSFYEFVASPNYNKSQAINIRYQVYKKDEIINFITRLDFSNIKFSKEYKDESTSWIDSLITIDTSNKIDEIILDNTKIANISYKLNVNKVKNELNSFLTNIIIFNLIIYLPILFILGFYHKVIFKKYVTEPVLYLNRYLDDIFENKFGTIDKGKFEGTKEIKELTHKISKLSSKIAALKNEINANKDSLEEKNNTDNLTGLPNKKIFNFDIKSMFITSTNGYIFIIRIDKLAEISKKHDTSYINSFIETYSNTIKNIIFRISKTNMKMYRFHGSEFAIIARNIDFEQASEMCEEIVLEIKDRLPFIYDVPEDLIHIGGTFFDLYGSLESVLASTNSAYEYSKQKGKNSYHIIAEEDIKINYSLIDNNVIDIIDKSAFEIDFVLDTYSFDNPNELVMREVSPQLYDHQGEKLPIGSFVAVAQKIKIADKFDKEVIKKSIDFIKQNNITYELAINLSISSIENEEFMSWLAQTLKDEKEIVKNIVFSITSYSAYLHKEIFIEFVQKVHEIGAKILLKRYKTDEYELNQLEELNLDYIRMHKEYTLNFTNDIVKKHKVKNIIIFGELNNINILADTVKLDLDYDLLERIGTYATSR